MTKRRTHSTIDKLPTVLREAITRMLVDNEWPADCAGAVAAFTIKGTPRYEDVVSYCKFKGFTVSESAVGRFGMRMRTLSRMKQAGVITREIMADLTNEKASQTQKACAEMITAVAIEFIAGHDDLNSKQISDVAKAMKDCTAIAINADKYIREQIDKKIKAADKSITDIAVKKKIPDEVLKMIKEQVYGIIT
jgi:hypothetical protein